MELLLNIVLGLAFIPIALFICFYGWGSPWYRTLQGMTMMAQSVLWLLLISHYLALALWDYPFHELVKNVLVALIMLTFWVTFLALVLAQTAPKPVSKRRGDGFVPSEDLESTLQTRARGKR